MRRIIYYQNDYDEIVISRILLKPVHSTEFAYSTEISKQVTCNIVFYNDVWEFYFLSAIFISNYNHNGIDVIGTIEKQ